MLLANLKPQSRHWDTYLDCLGGCLRHFGKAVSDAWLYGLSGHAFGLNIHQQLCPSGPHVWSGWGNLQRREAALGLDIERLGPWFKVSDQAYEDHKEQIWDRTRQALADELPCIGYDLSWAEFYLINGFDEAGYHFWQTDMGQLTQIGPLPWEMYGEGGVVHMLAVQVVRATEPVGDLRAAVQASLQWAVDFSAEGEKAAPEGMAAYRPGLAGYDQWISALEEPELSLKGTGAMYNAEVWRECRHYAVAFLTETKQRLAEGELSPLLDDALEHYQVVEQELGKVCQQVGLDPQNPNATAAERCEHAIRALQAAKQAETQGLQALGEIADLLLPSATGA